MRPRHSQAQCQRIQLLMTVAKPTPLQSPLKPMSSLRKSLLAKLPRRP